MSSEEKLQQLFQAALKAPETKQPLARAFPTRQPIPRGTTPAAPAEATPQPIAHTDPQLAVEQPTQSPDSHLTTTLPNAGLDEQTSSELGKLLDEQQTRIKRKNRRNLITTLAACIAIFGGGTGWFVSSPDRVTALRAAIAEIKSAGDIKSIVAKYQESLDKIAVRRDQIDNASLSMGVSLDVPEAADIFFEEEMAEMIDDEGKTNAERDRLFANKYKNGIPSAQEPSE